MSYICIEPDSAIQGQLVDDGNGYFAGECVSLVKHQCDSLRGKRTADWKQGKQVKGLATLARGTAIATFASAGKFEGHAAIYIQQDPAGIWVWDQYNKPPKGVGKRYLSFDDKKSRSNNGNQFYVVE
jgi:hypothetical protein